MTYRPGTLDLLTVPFVCTVWRDGLPFGITIEGARWEQVEATHPHVRVDGILRQVIEISAHETCRIGAGSYARKNTPA